MKITTVGIDLAKMLFQVHGVDERAKAALRKQLKRKDAVSFFANLEPCLIGRGRDRVQRKRYFGFALILARWFLVVSTT